MLLSLSFGATGGPFIRHRVREISRRAIYRHLVSRESSFNRSWFILIIGDNTPTSCTYRIYVTREKCDFIDSTNSRRVKNLARESRSTPKINHRVGTSDQTRPSSQIVEQHQEYFLLANVICLELRRDDGREKPRVMHYQSHFCNWSRKGSLGPPSLESRPDPEATFYGCLALTANGRLQLENLVPSESDAHEWKLDRV